MGAKEDVAAMRAELARMKKAREEREAAYGQEMGKALKEVERLNQRAPKGLFD
jgi:hypothetical protein